MREVMVVWEQKIEVLLGRLKYMYLHFAGHDHCECSHALVPTWKAVAQWLRGLISQRSSTWILISKSIFGGWEKVVNSFKSERILCGMVLEVWSNRTWVTKPHNFVKACRVSTPKEVFAVLKLDNPTGIVRGFFVPWAISNVDDCRQLFDQRPVEANTVLFLLLTVDGLSNRQEVRCQICHGLKGWWARFHRSLD